MHHATGAMPLHYRNRMYGVQVDAVPGWPGCFAALALDVWSPSGTGVTSPHDMIDHGP